MVICFNALPETRDQLDQLVASGAYRDYGEAIAAAVRNQILLEQEVALAGTLIVGEHTAQTPVPDAPAPLSAAKAILSVPTTTGAPKIAVKTAKTAPSRKPVAASAPKTTHAHKGITPSYPPTIPATFLL